MFFLTFGLKNGLGKYRDGSDISDAQNVERRKVNK